MIDRFTESELIQLTDRAGLSLIDSVVLDQAISDAAAEIDGYLTHYDLPLLSVPALLVRISCDIARYFLYDDMATEQVIRRFDASLKYLVSIGKGDIKLPGQSASSAAGQDLAVMQSDGSVFGRKNIY